MKKINLDDIKLQLENGKTIEEVIAKFDWKEFESLVAEIFRSNGFFVRKNLRFKTGRRYEIDVFAVNGETAFAVDCKEWSRGRHKKSSLKSASSAQEERARQLGRFLRNNPIAKKGLKIGSQKILPLVVTWLQEELQWHNESAIVPVWKLNSFLLQSENSSPTE